MLAVRDFFLDGLGVMSQRWLYMREWTCLLGKCFRPWGWLDARRECAIARTS